MFFFFPSLVGIIRARQTKQAEQMAQPMDSMPLVELLLQVSQTSDSLKLLGKDGMEAITWLAEAVAVSVNASSPRSLSDPSGY